ncbi:hypothetical protein BDF19DRAFT_428710 [Syncephalis fuscata]|nr:hypothetical protein BDF19DRAFT_428710 [Syncephalis fuscata]
MKPIAKLIRSFKPVSRGRLCIAVILLEVLHVTCNDGLTRRQAVEILKAERVPMPSTPANWFSDNVEGVTVDADGNMYATDFRAENNTSPQTPFNTIGRLEASTSKANIWYTDPSPNSWFNGARIKKPLDGSDDGGRMLVGDVNNHRVIELSWSGNRVPPKDESEDGGLKMRTVCADPSMIQPNDLAVTPDGQNIYLTGMKVTGDVSIGDLWHCRADGTAARFSADGMGRTNGIEVSPDGETLYVSESLGGWTPTASRIWRYRLEPGTGRVVERIGLLVDFTKLDNTGDVEVDGMRTDVTGALYVTRATRNEVVKLSPSGELLARIETTFNHPRNLELADSSITVGCVDKVTVSDPGRAWTELQ